ncbi:pyridoxal phosphate-dependent decarboxylase family protein [Winogradskyella luteola]|uniref:Glutamate or tyrosine decarboxylase n=1 Tax=Winogradskyella luteola TaxID=2828330 RepID=A0A9X1F782_9FLAO|nr:pyridoxal-dependent decarboxylase [Winogradskyella luteola]MBV7268697.1 hypothetical protein [Winogradskyella luteola]
MKSIKDKLLKAIDILDIKSTNCEITHSKDLNKLINQINKQLPKRPLDYDSLINDFKHQIIPLLNQNTSPNYAAYITGSSTEIGAIAEFIKGYYNQNGLKWINSPITSELEKLVVKWISEFILLPNFNHGMLTTGGSMSNLLAIHFSLANAYPNREYNGIPSDKIKVYSSDQTHSSVERAMVFLGLGRNSLVKISTDKSYKVNTEELEKRIKSDKASGYTPLIIIGNAGTTNTGAIDNLLELSKISNKYNTWFHIDGAYGLPAIRLKKLRARFHGASFADSITVNPHKWMYVPFEASCLLLKKIPIAINFTPDYLDDFSSEQRMISDQTIELTKEFRALKIWLTLKYYGADQISQFIENDIFLINYLSKKLKILDFVEIHPESELSILCFRFISENLNETQTERLNILSLKLIKENRSIFFTGTRLNNKVYMRIFFGNPNRKKKDVKFMLKKIIEVYNHSIKQI